MEAEIDRRPEQTKADKTYVFFGRFFDVFMVRTTRFCNARPV
jgi:hypothetical protein